MNRQRFTRVTFTNYWMFGFEISPECKDFTVAIGKWGLQIRYAKGQ